MPEGFLTLPVHLVWGAQRDVLLLLSEHSFCQFIVAEQRRCIVKGLRPKTGCESACCSYSVWRAQSAPGHRSTGREQPIARPAGPSARPAAPSPSERENRRHSDANRCNSPSHASQVTRGGTRGSRPAECKHVTTCVHVLGQSRHVLLMVI